ncbi:hypothetical protein MKQ68_13325 [Chitinophaga horti]|uniref:Chaperone of endosialidase n=1 Tax=Chitinophaga horti TaxID=2920382 RepID=A0ABY6IYI5_9BACT|nr:hypothetical protein [Chitinophaga horti]UYQ91074.1 hypothetical protein MKQ68_13325 [Chitinophaga horti]
MKTMLTLMGERSIQAAASLTLLMCPLLTFAQDTHFPGNVGVKTSATQHALQIGNYQTSNENKIVVPGTYNFERVSLGQDGNGAASLEFVNHISAENSFGVKIGASVDHFGRGMYFTAADVSSTYGSLSYNTTNPALFINLSNNVGIGTKTPNPSYKLDVEGTVGIKQTMFIRSNGINSTELLMYQENGTAYHSIFSNAAGLGFYNSASNNVSLFLRENGNVGIGTNSPEYKLAVAGTVGAKKVKVTMQGWPDYVFASNYQLRSIPEVAAFIDKHKHLPDIPNAAEVDAQGLDLGDMNKKLLQKIEELTLYLIDQHKKMEVMQEEISSLKKLIK